eukprot:COSAG01_NODE_1266_length_10987_cov_8.631980_5_plen_378_part_00
MCTQEAEHAAMVRAQEAVEAGLEAEETAVLWAEGWHLTVWRPPAAAAAAAAAPQAAAAAAAAAAESSFLLLCHADGDQLLLPYRAADVPGRAYTFRYRSSGDRLGLAAPDGGSGVGSGRPQQSQQQPAALEVTAEGEFALVADHKASFPEACVCDRLLDLGQERMSPRELGSLPAARYERGVRGGAGGVVVLTAAERRERAERRAAAEAGETCARLRPGYYTWGREAGWLLDSHSGMAGGGLRITSRHHRRAGAGAGAGAGVGAGLFELRLPAGGGLGFVDHGGKARAQQALRALARALARAAARYHQHPGPPQPLRDRYVHAHRRHQHGGEDAGEAAGTASEGWATASSAPPGSGVGRGGGGGGPHHDLTMMIQGP